MAKSEELTIPAEQTIAFIQSTLGADNIVYPDKAVIVCLLAADEILDRWIDCIGDDLLSHRASLRHIQADLLSIAQSLQGTNTQQTTQ